MAPILQPGEYYGTWYKVWSLVTKMLEKWNAAKRFCAVGKSNPGHSLGRRISSSEHVRLEYRMLVFFTRKVLTTTRPTALANYY